MEIAKRTRVSHTATSEGLGYLLGSVRKRRLQLHAHKGWLSKAPVGWGIQDAAEDGFKHGLAGCSDGFFLASVALAGCVGSTYVKDTSTCCSCGV